MDHMYGSTENIITNRRQQDHELKDIHVQTKEIDHEENGHSGDNSPTPPSDAPISEKLWLFEIAAWLIGVIGLIAIVIVLRATENKPTPSWQIKSKYTKTKLSVTINSVISIFSTLVKSTLLIPVAAGIAQLKWVWFRDGHRLSDFQVFDQAKGGPFGSFILLWTFRGKSLACLGAVIVISSLGVDFAFQQLVTYPLRPVIVAPAFIPRTNSYSGWRPGPITGIKLAELPMLGAAYTGLFSANDSFLVTPQCPSGNCVWEETYTTLGVCSQCYDITKDLAKQCGTYDISFVDENENNATYPANYCNYTLPGGQGIFGNYGSIRDPILMVLNNTFSSQPSNSTTYFGNGLHSHIAAYSIIRSDWEQVAPGDNYTTPGYYNLLSANATECGLDICVKKYRGSVTNSTFKEELLDTFVNTTDFSFADAEGSIASLFVQPPESWTNHTNAKDANLFMLDPFTITALEFLFSGSDPGFFQGAFSDSLVGQVSSDSDIVTYIRYLDNAGVDNMMNSLAASMTLRMRTAPGNEDFGLGANTTGQTLNNLPHVNVRWAWLAFPVTLLILALLFLILVMIENARNGAMLWKSNALAAFHHPLTKEGRAQLQSARTAAQAEEIAKNMSVKWERTDVGYRLVSEHER